jgi:hypothetical protein
VKGLLVENLIFIVSFLVDLRSEDFDEAHLKGPPKGYVVSGEPTRHRGLVGSIRGQSTEVRQS